MRTLSSWDAMALATAGYTGMLSVLALEDGGITPDRGDVLVIGAGGGCRILSGLGYRVVATRGPSRNGGLAWCAGLHRTGFSAPSIRIDAASFPMFHVCSTRRVSLTRDVSILFLTFPVFL